MPRHTDFSAERSRPNKIGSERLQGLVTTASLSFWLPGCLSKLSCNQNQRLGYSALIKAVHKADFPLYNSDIHLSFAGLISGGAEWDVSNRDDPVDDDFVIYPKGEENATEPKHEIQPTDIVLFDNNACSMVICGFYSDSFMGYTAKAYYQNKTDDRIDIILDKGSINGFECTPEGAALLEPHSNAYVDIRWQEYAETYAENGNDPTSITEIVMPVFVRKDTGNNTVYIDATYSIDPQARTATPIVNPQ